MKDKKILLFNSVIVIFIILFAIYTESLSSPPEPAPADASPLVFSAERALNHIKVMCRKPHFIGTPEHSRVRKYIADTVKELGLKVEIQTATVLDNSRRSITAAKVHNVIATLKGTGSSKGVLISGHYDSMLHTPGAADDGSAVGAMLETARALTKSPPLKNDIIFLFSDGEEEGLMGAKAFVNQHPLIKNVGVVFNLEARGNKGTSVTFEVSNENGWIMKEYTKAIPFPFAASIMYEIYKLMPNDTDFTAFKKAGYSGFNAAFIDGYVNYHSATDKPANLNLSSLQHHGSYILNFAKHFGNLNITETKEKDVVFFNPIGHWLLVYPGWLNLPLVISISLLFLIYIVTGIKTGHLTFKGIIGGFFLYVGSAIVITFLSALIQSGIKILYPHYSHFYSHNFYNIHYYFYVFIGIATALFSLFYVLLYKKIKNENFQAGAIVFFIILMILLYIKMPTAAYLVIYPIAFVLLAGIATHSLKWREDNKPVLYSLIYLFAALPAIALFTPLIRMLFITFSLNKGFISSLVTVILLGFLIPQLKAAYKLNRYILPIIAGLVALAGFTGGHITSLPNETQPLQTSVVYCLDQDHQKALWVSKYLEPDDWNIQYFDDAKIEPLVEIYPEPLLPRLKNEAPLIKLPKSRIKILENRRANNQKRKILFKILPWNKGNSMFLFIHKEAGISQASIDGIPISKETDNFYSPKHSDYHNISYYAVPAEGIDISIECQQGKRLRLVIIDWKLGLPVIPGYNYKPMPDYIIPDKDFSHFTVVKRTVLL